MHKLLLVASIVVAIFAAPQKKATDDQCGARAVQQYTYIPTGNAADFECEMCLDLVLIGETYAECDEAKVEHVLEDKCDKDYKGPADKACRGMVDKVAHKVIEDTNADPTTVCKDIIHKTCTYSKV